MNATQTLVALTHALGQAAPAAHSTVPSCVVFTDQGDAQSFNLEGNASYEVLDSKRNEWDDGDVYFIAMVQDGGDPPCAWVAAELLEKY